ncbi:MAG: hypothetical protein KGH63_04520, partial [Candidatus Micrarchaeota archaeon]|nr:hypothetical protein [Candidatus Micrarchaeota archaeon]
GLKKYLKAHPDEIPLDNPDAVPPAYEQQLAEKLAADPALSTISGLASKSPDEVLALAMASTSLSPDAKKTADQMLALQEHEQQAQLKQIDTGRWVQDIVPLSTPDLAAFAQAQVVVRNDERKDRTQLSDALQNARQQLKTSGNVDSATANAIATLQASVQGHTLDAEAYQTTGNAVLQVMSYNLAPQVNEAVSQQAHELAEEYQNATDPAAPTLTITLAKPVAIEPHQTLAAPGAPSVNVADVVEQKDGRTVFHDDQGDTYVAVQKGNQLEVTKSEKEEVRQRIKSFAQGVNNAVFSPPAHDQTVSEAIEDGVAAAIEASKKKP